MKRSPLRRKPRARPTAEEREHLDRVARMPCLVCGATAEVHHVRGYADKAGIIARAHSRAVPLCPTHHRVDSPGRVAVHDLGHRGFYREHNIDLLAEAEKLWNERLTLRTQCPRRDYRA